MQCFLSHFPAMNFHPDKIKFIAKNATFPANHSNFSFDPTIHDTILSTILPIPIISMNQTQNYAYTLISLLFDLFILDFREISY